MFSGKTNTDLTLVKYMTNEPNSNSFFNDLLWTFILALIFVIIAAIFSGCTLFQKTQKTKEEIKSDSTSVKKVTETSSKVDTSKTSSTNTKETVYYPQPIIVPGKNGETKVVFVPQTIRETGTEEKQNFNYEDYRKDLIDSMRIANLELALSKQSETKTSILGFGFWLGVSLLGIVLIGLMVMVLRMKSQFTSINSLLTKK